MKFIAKIFPRLRRADWIICYKGIYIYTYIQSNAKNLFTPAAGRLDYMYILSYTYSDYTLERNPHTQTHRKLKV